MNSSKQHWNTFYHMKTLTCIHIQTHTRTRATAAPPDTHMQSHGRDPRKARVDQRDRERPSHAESHGNTRSMLCMNHAGDKMSRNISRIEGAAAASTEAAGGGGARSTTWQCSFDSDTTFSSTPLTAPARCSTIGWPFKWSTNSRLRDRLQLTRSVGCVVGRDMTRNT